MIPAPFDYARAGSAGEAAALLAEYGDEAKLLAGGHSLLPMMKLRLASPSVLVDVGHIEDLRYVRRDGDTLAVGALARHADLAGSDVVRQSVPLLGLVASRVGDPQVRHRGTIGGSLAHADPSADLPAAMLALDAQLVALGPDGQRRIAAADFFAGYFTTALAQDEILTEIRIPVTGSEQYWYEKFVRRANDWAIVAVAVAGTRIALAGMGPTPLSTPWRPAPMPPEPPNLPRRAPSPRKICTPTRTTAGTWPGCSPTARSSGPPHAERAAADSREAGRAGWSPATAAACLQQAASGWPMCGTRCPWRWVSGWAIRWVVSSGRACAPGARVRRPGSTSTNGRPRTTSF